MVCLSVHVSVKHLFLISSRPEQKPVKYNSLVKSTSEKHSELNGFFWFGYYTQVMFPRPLSTSQFPIPTFTPSLTHSAHSSYVTTINHFVVLWFDLAVPAQQQLKCLIALLQHFLTWHDHLSTTGASKWLQFASGWLFYEKGIGFLKLFHLHGNKNFLNSRLCARDSQLVFVVVPSSAVVKAKLKVPTILG